MSKKVRRVPIVDITDQVGISQEDLALIYETNTSDLDFETDGLNALKNGITEIAAMKVVKERGQYRVKAFSAFVLPLTPAYREYEAALAAGRQPEYDRRKYEYDSSLEAFAVTGTEFGRESFFGPITSMRTEGEERDAYLIDEALPQMRAFHHEDVSAYNGASFDMPMNAAKEREIHGADVALPDYMANPARAICLMYLFLFVNGEAPSNRLDDAYRTLVDPTYTEREEHKGFEDVGMQLKVKAQLIKIFRSMGWQEKKLPRIEDLFRIIIQEVDPGAEVISNDKGEIRVTFSRDPREFEGRAAKLWEFIDSFRAVNNWNSNAMVPRHILTDKEYPRSLTLSGASMKPGERSILLTFLTKLMFHREVMNTGLIEDMRVFDSTSRVDIVVTGEGEAEERIVKDVPLSSLRKSWRYLAAHPEHLQGNLELIKRVCQHQQVGLCILNNDADGHESVTVRPHRRGFGDVTFSLPQGTRIGRWRNDIVENLSDMIAIGAIPDVGGASSDFVGEGEDGKEGAGDRGSVVRSSVRLGKKSPLQVEVGERLYGAMLRFRGDAGLGVKITPTGGGTYMLEGTREEFQQLSRTLKDASWVLYQLGKVPGTHGLSMDGNMVTLHQNWGIEAEALEILRRAGAECTVTGRSITLNLDDLMQDGYRWAQTIDKPKRLVPSQAMETRQLQLWEGKLPAAEMDGTGQLWALDKGGHCVPVKHEGGQVPPLDAKGNFVLSRGGVEGAPYFTQIRSWAQKVEIRMHPMMAYVMQHMHGHGLSFKRQNGWAVLETTPAEMEARSPALETAARFLYLLGQTHGMAHLPLAGISANAEGEFRLQLPKAQALGARDYATPLAALSGRIRADDMQRALDMAKLALPPASAMIDMRALSQAEMADVLHMATLAPKKLKLLAQAMQGLIAACEDKRLLEDVAAGHAEIMPIDHTLTREAGRTPAAANDDALRKARWAANGVKVTLGNVPFTLGRLAEDAGALLNKIEGKYGLLAAIEGWQRWQNTADAQDPAYAYHAYEAQKKLFNTTRKLVDMIEDFDEVLTQSARRCDRAAEMLAAGSPAQKLLAGIEPLLQERAAGHIEDSLAALGIACRREGDALVFDGAEMLRNIPAWTGQFAAQQHAVEAPDIQAAEATLPLHQRVRIQAGEYLSSLLGEALGWLRHVAGRIGEEVHKRARG